MSLIFYFWYFFILIFGLLVGSFLNCVIYRLEVGGNFLKGRSFCPKCKHILKWYDLIPIFSFITLRRKCRYCDEKISWQYPLVEISTGLMFLLIFNFQFFPTSSRILDGFAIGTIFNFQTIFNIFFLLLITSFLIIIFVYDLKYFIIPDRVIFPAIGLVLIYRIFKVLKLAPWDSIDYWLLDSGVIKPFIYALISAVGASLFFLLIFLISRGKWMGFGDVKLAFLMGLFLGSPNILVALFSAFLIGAIIGIGLIVVKRKTLKSEVPFGPFLITGTFIALFYGEKIINWYLNLFYAFPPI